MIKALSYYYLLLDMVYNHYDYKSKPRDLKIREKMNHMFVVNPKYPLYKNPARSVPKKYLAGELIWYFNGDDSVKFISQFSKFWERIANPDGSCNSAYGKRIFSENPIGTVEFSEKGNIIFTSEYSWAYHSLIKDKDTRQAIILFNKPWHKYDGNKDFTCTMYVNFHIRNNFLNMSVKMRSSDLIKGITFDVPFFCILQQQMYRHLLPTYPDLMLGLYNHVSDSLHIYESDFGLVEEMLKHRTDTDDKLILDTDLIDISTYASPLITQENELKVNTYYQMKPTRFMEDFYLNLENTDLKNEKSEFLHTLKEWLNDEGA